MKISQTGELSLSRSHITDPVSLDFSGPFSIQSVVFCSDTYEGVTYSVLVSLDKDNWENFSEDTNDVSIVDSLQFNFELFPWKYVKIVTNGTVPTGTVKFIFAY